jgi:hypothetical protein
MLTLASQVQSRRQFVTNEETTKHSLIVPFIQTLGYDVFNPQEVRPEYSADFGKKKGEKVDYAIICNDKPIIFIEAKSINENLKNHEAQLSRYFNSTPSVKVAVLTNGIKYKFFTDLKENNIMDLEPFFEFDVLNLNDYTISIVQKFNKEYFDQNLVGEMARELNNIANINSTLRDLFENPTDDFIRFLIKDICKDRLTASVIERFRPIVKKSIKDAVIAIVSQGLFAQDMEIPIEIKEESESSKPGKKEPSSETIEKEKPIKLQRDPNPEEIEVFETVKKTLIAYGKNVDDLNCKVTSSYFAIYNKNINKWFFRLNLDSAQKQLITRLQVDQVKELCTSGYEIEQSPKGNGESRILINKHTDIKGLKSLIVTCFDQTENDKE